MNEITKPNSSDIQHIYERSKRSLHIEKEKLKQLV